MDQAWRNRLEKNADTYSIESSMPLAPIGDCISLCLIGTRASIGLSSVLKFGACLVVEELNGWVAGCFLGTDGDELLPGPNQKFYSSSLLSGVSAEGRGPRGTCSEIQLNRIWTLYVKDPTVIFTDSSTSSILSQKKSRSNIVRSSHLRQVLLALWGKPKLQTIVAIVSEFQQTKGRLRRLALTLSLSWCGIPPLFWSQWLICNEKLLPLVRPPIMRLWTSSLDGQATKNVLGSPSFLIVQALAVLALHERASYTSSSLIGRPKAVT